MKTASRKWMWASLCLTLILGTGLGVAVDRLLLERQGEDADRQERGARLVQRLSRELELTPQQQAAVEATLASNRERARQFWDASRASFEKLREEFHQEIRAQLNAEQQRRFDEMVQREDERRKRREDDR
jgi:hypothetical protein